MAGAYDPTERSGLVTSANVRKLECRCYSRDFVGSVIQSDAAWWKVVQSTAAVSPAKLVGWPLRCKAAAMGAGSKAPLRGLAPGVPGWRR